MAADNRTLALEPRDLTKRLYHDVERVRTSVGNNTYLLCSSRGEAAVVDPPRDVRDLLSAAERRGVRISFALETHVHSDYVSGAHELARRTGAEVVAPRGGGWLFPHRPVGEGAEIRLGEFQLFVLETPGHTPEHCSYLIWRDGADRPEGIFTGGSLLVGGAGRSDLLGRERAPELARAQVDSVRRLLQLDDEVLVLPTYGAGSACAVGAVGRLPMTTVGRERAARQEMQTSPVEALVDAHLREPPAIPQYFANMPAINRAGAREFFPTAVEHLTIEAARRRMQREDWVVDGRRAAAFARAHIPASLNIEFGDQFAQRVGALVPFNEPILLVADAEGEQRIDEVATELAGVGYERITGVVAGGIEAWRAADLPVAMMRQAPISDVVATAQSPETLIVDVRERSEWAAGHLRGSAHIPLAELPFRLAEIPSERVIITICTDGKRAVAAASLLRRAGRQGIFVGEGGVEDILRATLTDSKARVRFGSLP